MNGLNSVIAGLLAILIIFGQQPLFPVNRYGITSANVIPVTDADDIDDITALRTIADCYYLQVKDISTAGPYYERLLLLGQNTPEILQPLCHYYYVTGDYEKSIEMGQRGLEGCTSDISDYPTAADIDLYMGRSYYMLNRPREALLHLNNIWNTRHTAIEYEAGAAFICVAAEYCIRSYLMLNDTRNAMMIAESLIGDPNLKPLFDSWSVSGSIPPEQEEAYRSYQYIIDFIKESTADQR